MFYFQFSKSPYLWMAKSSLSFPLFLTPSITSNPLPAIQPTVELPYQATSISLTLFEFGTQTPSILVPQPISHFPTASTLNHFYSRYVSIEKTEQIRNLKNTRKSPEIRYFLYFLGFNQSLFDSKHTVSTVFSLSNRILAFSPLF